MGGGKTRENFYPKTHVYCEFETIEKNRLEKVRKHVFYKHMNIVTKNVGKTREKIFPETQSIRKQTTMEKNRLEKVRKHFFFINTRIS